MDQFVYPTLQSGMLNHSLQQKLFNDTYNESVFRHITLDGGTEGNDVSEQDRRIADALTLVTCVLAIPGNVLVIAVYALKMITSIRMYMFALAIADLVTCVYGIVLATATFSYVGLEIALHCAFLTLSFSLYLLAFVSVERLLAVLRPGTFSLSLLRAKRALVAITVAAIATAVVLTTARLIQNKMLLYSVQATIIVSCVAVMIVCYSLMGITMVKKERAAHTSIGIASSAPLPGPSTMSAEGTELPTVSGPANTSSSKHSAKPCIKSTAPIQQNTLKSIYLLFIITLVFLISWMPRWVTYVGLEIPLYARRTFFLNSAVNPFIYGVMSRMFRVDVQQLYRRIRTRLQTC